MREARSRELTAEAEHAESGAWGIARWCVHLIRQHADVAVGQRYMCSWSWGCHRVRQPAEESVGDVGACFFLLVSTRGPGSVVLSTEPPGPREEDPSRHGLRVARGWSCPGPAWLPVLSQA